MVDIRLELWRGSKLRYICASKLLQSFLERGRLGIKLNRFGNINCVARTSQDPTYLVSLFSSRMIPGFISKIKHAGLLGATN